MAVLSAWLVVIGIFSAPVWADPEDLTLESYTDDHPNGKNKEAEAKKTAALPPEERAKAEAAALSPEEREKTFFVEEEQVVETGPHEKINPEDDLCHSTKEYIDTLNFLRRTDTILLTEATSRKIADRVSRSCDGGAMRFIKVLGVLKAMGLSDRRSVQIGLQFAAKSAEVQRSFLEIFTQSYLSEFFDYDYATAVELAFELSKNFKGNPKEVRQDFIELVRFCKDGKKLDLPARLCAEFTVRVARLSQYYPTGVRDSFRKLYQRFRDDKAFSLDVKSALEITYGILKFGPHAPSNFFTGYEYAVRKDGLEMSHADALEFGLKMASRSYRGEGPPVIPPGYEMKVIQRAITTVR